MRFEVKPASRIGIIPLFGIWGGTGSGKTRSALMLARGMAGEHGKVGIVDTEGKRASYYADSIPGGYDRIDFDAPYDPESYIEALDLLEKNCDVGILDSASHAWQGPDGILDLHEQTLDRMLKDKKDDWQERARLNWPAWREPKLRFVPLRNRILGFKKPLIVCFRGELKSHMEKDDRGKNTIVTDSTTTPIFDTRFLFEMHVAIELFQKDGAGGFTRYPMPWAKTSHDGLRKCLPKPEAEQLTIAHGAAIKAWCSVEQGPGTNVAAASKPADPLRDLKKTLWKMLDPVSPKDQKDWATREQWLLEQGIISDTETVNAMTQGALVAVIEQVPKFLPAKP